MSDDFSFEKAYARLEEILEQLNEGEVALDTSLALYEEADKLIKQCSAKLTGAEEKIRQLLKKDDGTLATDSNNTPQTAPFTQTQEGYMTREVNQ